MPSIEAPPNGGNGGLRRGVPQKKYSPASKFPRMFLSEAARLISRGRRVRGMCTGKAAFESVRLVPSSTQSIPIMARIYASSAPRRG